MTSSGRLTISSTQNQDNPLMKGVVRSNTIPFMTCDVWEHAYYLQHQNRRPEYLGHFWKIIDWARVGKMYEEFACNQKPVPVDSLLE